MKQIVFKKTHRSKQEEGGCSTHAAKRVCSLVLFCHGVTYKWCFWLILKFVNRLLAHGSLSVLVVQPVLQLSRDLQSWPHQVRRGAPSLCTWAVDTSAVLSCTGAASVAICGRLLSGPGTAGTERRWRTCGFYQLVLVGLPLVPKQICSPGGTWQQAVIPAPLGSALCCRALCDPLLQCGFQFLTGTSLHWCHWAVSICHSLLSSWGAPMGWLSERSSCSAGADFSLVLWKKKKQQNWFQFILAIYALNWGHSAAASSTAELSLQGPGPPGKGQSGWTAKGRNSCWCPTLISHRCDCGAALCVAKKTRVVGEVSASLYGAFLCQ